MQKADGPSFAADMTLAAKSAKFDAIIPGVGSGKYNIGVSSFTINSEREALFAAAVGERVFGKGNVFTDAEPTMGGEDFSYMLQARPGAFIFVGNGNTAGLHNPAYDFNDEAIPVGTSYWARLVETAMPG